MALEFQKPLSISQLSVVQLTQQIWKSPRSISVLKTLLTSDLSAGKSESNYYSFLRRLYKDVSERLDQLQLPGTLQNELKTSVGIFGENILLWLGELSSVMAFMSEDFIQTMEKYIDNMCWTGSGMIDTRATFRKVYPIDTEKVDYFMWMQACELCLEDYVIQWSPKSEKVHHIACKLLFEGQDLVEDPESYNTEKFWHDQLTFLNQGYSYHILMYWKIRKYGSETKEDWMAFIAFLKYGTTSDYYEIYDERDSIDENMLRLSIVEGRFAAVQYFWSKLAAKERKRNLVKMAAITIWCNQKCTSVDALKRRSREYTDILVLLIGYMTPEELEAILNDDLRSEIGHLPMYFHLNRRCEHANILSMLRNSTWRHLFLPIASKALKYFNNLEYNSLIVELLRPSFYDIVMFLYNAYQSFCQVWKESSVELKSSIKLENCLNSPALKNDPITFALLLKCIVNDVDLRYERQIMLDCVQTHCPQLIFHGKFYFLELFVTRVLQSEQERGLFKNKINFSVIKQTLINKGEYGLMSKFANWMCEKEEYMIRLKEGWHVPLPKKRRLH